MPESIIAFILVIGNIFKRVFFTVGTLILASTVKLVLNNVANADISGLSRVPVMTLKVREIVRPSAGTTKCNFGV